MLNHPRSGASASWFTEPITLSQNLGRVPAHELNVILMHLRQPPGYIGHQLGNRHCPPIIHVIGTDIRARE